MCGIAGFLAKREGVPVAESLTAMLQALFGRGPDSTGLSLYGAPHEGRHVASVWAGDDGGLSARERVLEAVDRHGTLAEDDYHEGYFRVGLTPEDGSPAGTAARWPRTSSGRARACASSRSGSSLEVIKYTADARTMFERWSLGGIPFTHAIGHVRMATESRVDVNHSHPFWARPFPDVTVAHNGHVTNYYKNRRIYEMRGYTFQTDNDTEFVAVYLAEQMAERTVARRGGAAVDRRPRRLVHVPRLDARGLRGRARPLLDEAVPRRRDGRLGGGRLRGHRARRRLRRRAGDSTRTSWPAARRARGTSRSRTPRRGSHG